MNHPAFRGLLMAIVLGLIAAGCGGNPADQTLETDSNGYLCKECQAKFYTEREVFADACPKCRSMQLIQVVGFVCETDQQMSIGPRAGGPMRCQKCGKATSGLAIPRESDLVAWGATKQTAAEVSGGPR